MTESNHRSRRSEPSYRPGRRWVLLATALAISAGFAAAAGPQAPDETARDSKRLPLETLTHSSAGQEFHVFDDQLAWIVNVALPQNPEARSARSLWRAKLESIDSQSALPNPRVAYRYYGGAPETRVGPQEHSIQFSQAVPGFGKRKLQSTLAGIEADVAAWRARDAERGLVFEIKRTYFDAAYVTEALRVNAEEAALLKRFESIALERYASGAGIQQNVIRVQTDLNQLGDQAIMLGQHLEHSVHRIAQLMGNPERILHLNPIDLSLREIDLSAARTAHHDMQDNSRTQAARRQVEVERTRTDRLELETRPDFRFSAGYVDVGKRTDLAGVLAPPPDNGSDIWSVGVEVSIPIYRRGTRSAIDEAQERRRFSEERLRHTENQIGHQIHGALVSMEALEHRARLYQDVIVPQAGESLASAEAAYTNNRLDFRDLLDAQRVLFKARLMTQRLLADYWIAAAEMEYSLGRSFPDGPPTIGGGS